MITKYTERMSFTKLKEKIKKGGRRMRIRKG